MTSHRTFRSLENNLLTTKSKTSSHSPTTSPINSKKYSKNVESPSYTNFKGRCRSTPSSYAPSSQKDSKNRKARLNLSASANSPRPVVQKKYRKKMKIRGLRQFPWTSRCLTSEGSTSTTKATPEVWLHCRYFKKIATRREVSPRQEYWDLVKRSSLLQSWRKSKIKSKLRSIA